jgi:SagB-type dehydrogenase family enzyme
MSEQEPLEVQDPHASGPAPREDIYVGPPTREFVSDEERLHEVFHANTKLDLVSEMQTGYMFAKVVSNPMLHRTLANPYRANPGLERVKLPPPTAIILPYTHVIGRRRTVRDYDGGAIDLARLSTVLHTAYGITGECMLEGNIPLMLRSVPSGGGLYPLELYVIASRIEGLERDEVYHYLAREHALERLGREVPVAELSATLLGSRPECVLPSAATILVAGVFVRMTYKYDDRGYRFVLMESGAVSAQINFAATGLGLGSCQVAGYYDDRVNAYVGVDGVNESVLNCVVVGCPAAASR